MEFISVKNTLSGNSGCVRDVCSGAGASTQEQEMDYCGNTIFFDVSHLYEGIIFSMLCQILPIAVIQTPKPDLIPRLYLLLGDRHEDQQAAHL